MAIESEGNDLRLWHRHLGRVPTFTGAMLDDIVARNSKTTSDRGYTFFIEGYVHDFKGERVGT